MVDVNIRGGGPRGTVVGTLPCSRGSGAGGVLHNVCAVTGEDDFARVAGACDIQFRLLEYSSLFIPDWVIQ